jgi:hypothetical protein
VFQVSTFPEVSLSEFCEYLLSSPFKLHTQSILTCLHTNLKSKWLYPYKLWSQATTEEFAGMTEHLAEQCCFYAFYSGGHVFCSWPRNKLIILPEVFIVCLMLPSLQVIFEVDIHNKQQPCPFISFPICHHAVN